ncbi:MAG: hypothetical protein ACYTEW_21455, partial [Planctomycetota bacterium]
MKRFSTLVIGLFIVVALGLIAADGPPRGWRSTINPWRPLKPKYNDRYMGYLPLQRTWTDSGNNVHDGDTILQPCLVYQDGTYYCFYEYTDAGAFKIGVAYTTDLGGTWTNVEDLLVPSGDAGEPDEDDIADPTVLYIPWSSTPWHMWFDMQDDDTGWTVGHATATTNPHVPASWTKQDLDSNDATDIVIALGTGDTFEGYDATNVHCPEAFIWGGAVHILYGAIGGSAHTSYDTMLAIANDSHGLGYKFEKWGPVTTDATLAAQDLVSGGDRMSSVLVYDGIIYSCIYQSATKNYWVCSTDGGRSWREFGEQPTGGSTDGFHSFLVTNDRIWAVTQSNADLYYLNLNNLSGAASGTREDSGVRTNLEYMNNVYRGYFIQGNPIVYSDSGIPTFPNTFASTREADEDSIRMSFTGAGSDNSDWLNGLKVNFLAGYTGTNKTHGIFSRNNTASGLPIGIRADSVGEHTGINYGLWAYADNDDGSGSAHAIWAEIGDGAT